MTLGKKALSTVGIIVVGVLVLVGLGGGVLMFNKLCDECLFAFGGGGGAGMSSNFATNQGNGGISFLPIILFLIVIYVLGGGALGITQYFKKKRFAPDPKKRAEFVKETMGSVKKIGGGSTKTTEFNEVTMLFEKVSGKPEHVKVTATAKNDTLSGDIAGIRILITRSDGIEAAPDQEGDYKYYLTPILIQKTLTAGKSAKVQKVLRCGPAAADGSYSFRYKVFWSEVTKA